MQCPATGHSFPGRVDRFERLRADLTPLFTEASRSIQAHSIPRLSRDFYFPFPKNRTGNALGPAGFTLLSRSFP